MTWKQIVLIIALAAMVAGGAFWSGTCYQKQHDIADWNATKPDTVLVSDTTRIKFLESELGAVDARLSTTKVRLDAVQYKRMQETLALRIKADSLNHLLGVYFGMDSTSSKPVYIAVETATMDTSFPVHALILPKMDSWGSEEDSVFAAKEFSIQTVGHIKTEYVGRPISQFDKTSFLLDPIRVPTDQFFITRNGPIQTRDISWWERLGYVALGGAIVGTTIAVTR